MTSLPQLKTYGIDLDGVSFDFSKGFRDWLRKNLDLHITDEEITSYYWFQTCLKISEKDFWEEFHKFGQNGGYKNLEVIPGTLEALNKIAIKGHKIVYITSRPDYATQDTKDALLMHNFPFAHNVHIAGKSKVPLIYEHEVDVFIDDSPTTIHDIVWNTEVKVYCRDYLFNRNLSVPVTRVTSWHDFLTHEGLHE